MVGSRFSWYVLLLLRNVYYLFPAHAHACEDSARHTQPSSALKLTAPQIATKAVIRLIDLTTVVRALVQTGQKAKIPASIQKEVDQYLKWAAKDGGYDNIDILPNIFVEVVDVNLGGTGISNYMQSQLRDLARSHRRFWSKRKKEAGGGDEEDETMADAQEPNFTTQPPVLYGLFIVNTTLLVLTIDPTKGEDAQVSYQVEVNFNKKNQGVWNAMTVAIVGCQARNDTIWRKQYYAGRLKG